MQSVPKPWGSYLILESRPGYQVKRITIMPGGKLSLQSHRQRSEHWIVVNGTADVSVGATKSKLARGQSVNIPLGEKHRLENHGSEIVDVIEVQFGDYLGEDDIVRYEDVYGRT